MSKELSKEQKGTKKNFGSKGWTPERITSLKGKTYLITGANSGTGFEASKILLSKGAKVVMLNRSGNKTAAVIAKFKQELGENIDLSFIHMDLSMQDSVRRAAEEVLEKVPQIDALICNAAIAQLAKREITIDGYEGQFGINHYGHFLLCGLLFDRIEQSHGRIVMVGSLAYNMGLKKIQFEDMNMDKNYTPWGAYAHSKLAEMMFGYDLQRRVKEAGKNMEVHVCHPGAARTDLIKGENVSLIMKISWNLFFAPFVAQSAEKGSYSQIMCATEDGLELEKLWGPINRGGMVGPAGENKLESHALDRDVAEKLWTLSEESTGLEWSV